MKRLKLEDNKDFDLQEHHKGAELENVKNKLDNIANKKINDLLNEYPNLFIFPQDKKDFKDDIESQIILTLKGNVVHTGNLMGFIGIDDLLITIRSRFDSDDKQYFLQYMLSKVFAMNLVDYQSSFGKDDIWRFLLYFVFVALLKKALKQGVYKKYVWNEYNNPNVKGRINISRHIKENTPFQGNIAYDVREYSYDNKITQLIRHTIEFIQERKSFGIFRDTEIIQAINLIKQITPNYKKSERQLIKHKNLRPLNHPFFTDYEPLRRVCIEILNYESIAYRESQKRVYGVLFDGAWLWEEYLYTILKSLGFIHTRNKESKGRKYLFIDNTGVIYPDFYIDGEIVLDAKYKNLDSDIAKVNKEDLYQLITYLHVLKAKKGFLIFPTQNDNKKKGKNPIGTLYGYGGEIGTFGFTVPKEAKDYNTFVNQIIEAEKKLKAWAKGN